MWKSHIFQGLISAVLLAKTAFTAPTCNIPSNRACWSPGFNINTDYELAVPFTGVVRSYTLTITEVDNYVGKDGQTKQKAMLINGQFPGPVLTADWGDTFSITVINKLRTNGTSTHWHGIRQLNNSINDGANGVTECPIPPGHQKTYTFLAQQYGTTWYHSHTSSQYAYGVTGSIVINGPASLPYDIDLGVFPISDWYLADATAIQEGITASAFGAPPPSDNVLFNGTNIDPKDTTGTKGAYAKVTLTPGKRHRLRIINPSVENTFTVSLVGHQFTVIETDFVPVNAFTTSSIYLGVGQRYDVTIDASQPVGNYWFNVTFSGTGACGTSVNPFPAAIFSYQGAPNAKPTNKGTAPPDSLCQDNHSFSPVVTRQAPLTNFSPVNNDLLVSLQTPGGNGVSQVSWKVNGSAIKVDWTKPTLEYIREGNQNFPANFNVLKIPNANQWSVWLIQNETPVPHPMHLHGHDFLILGSSPPLANPFGATALTPFNPATDTARLNTSNPTRRDVTMLPSWGWLVVAFKTDNPGAWLFHCHIAWHVSEGLSVQFVEQASILPFVTNLNAIVPNCQAWDAYSPTDPFQPTQNDSGI